MVLLAHVALRWADAAHLGMLVAVLPIGIGWMAAARFALLDDTQFQAHTSHYPVPPQLSRSASVG